MSFRLARDPAVLLTLFATALRALAAFGLNVTPEQQSWWNAAAAAIAGAAVAVFVKKDKQLPAILGVLSAVMALAVGYGLDWSAEQQMLVMSLAGGILAFWTRTQVDAPVPTTPPVVAVAARPNVGPM